MGLVHMPDDADALREFIALLYDPRCVLHSAFLDTSDRSLQM